MSTDSAESRNIKKYHIPRLISVTTRIMIVIVIIIKVTIYPGYMIVHL